MMRGDVSIADRAARVMFERDQITETGYDDLAQALADAGLLAPEPHVVTSVEELDALPDGTILRSMRPTHEAFQKRDGAWRAFGQRESAAVPLPAVVCGPVSEAGDVDHLADVIALGVLGWRVSQLTQRQMNAVRHTAENVTAVLTPTPAPRATVTREQMDAARFKVASVHHLHDGQRCLCGFDSHGRARSATEHILDSFMDLLTTPAEKGGA